MWVDFIHFNGYCVLHHFHYHENAMNTNVVCAAYTCTPREGALSPH